MSPLAAQLLPFSTATFMGIVGVVEVAVGLAILTGWTRIGAYAAGAWLLGVAVNLAAAGFTTVRRSRRARPYAAPEISLRLSRC